MKASLGNEPDPQFGSSTDDRSVRTLTVTGGSLRNSYLYLPLDFFPKDAVGGSNRSEEAAERTIRMMFTPGRAVESDIDGTKRILRDRGAVADFFAKAGLREGDLVRLTKTGPYQFEISKVSNE